MCNFTRRGVEKSGEEEGEVRRKRIKNTEIKRMTEIRSEERGVWGWKVWESAVRLVYHSLRQSLWGQLVAGGGFDGWEWAYTRDSLATGVNQTRPGCQRNVVNKPVWSQRSRAESIQRWPVQQRDGWIRRPAACCSAGNTWRRGSQKQTKKTKPTPIPVSALC